MAARIVLNLPLTLHGRYDTGSPQDRGCVFGLTRGLNTGLHSHTNAARQRDPRYRGFRGQRLRRDLFEQIQPMGEELGLYVGTFNMNPLRVAVIGALEQDRVAPKGGDFFLMC